MKPGFELSEARDMLALAYAADLMGPAGFDKSVAEWKKDYTNDPNSPLKADDGTKFPYPERVWPQGWTPGIEGLADVLPENKSIWNNSVIVPTPFQGRIEDYLNGLFALFSEDSDGNFWTKALAAALAARYRIKEVGANNCVIAYNKARNAYVISFAGTQNVIGGLEDLVFLPVPAGPLGSDKNDESTDSEGNPLLSSDANYMYAPIDPNTGQPREQLHGTMHLGFRLAVEQFTVKAPTGKSLLWYLSYLNKQDRGKDEQGRLRLYITGHSLGAAMGSIFTAYLQANQHNAAFRAANPGFPELDMKMYVFATPKTGNNAFLKAFNFGLTNDGKAFHVDNVLDAVPEIPFTIQTVDNLCNPDMLLGMLKPLPEPEGEETSELTDDELAQKLETEEEPEQRSRWIQLLAGRAIKTAAAAGNKVGGVLASTPAAKAVWNAMRISTGYYHNHLAKYDNTYGHLGTPIHLNGAFPRTAESAIIPARYYPGDNKAKKAAFLGNDKVIRLWWQHWPWVYLDALDQRFGQND